MSSHILKIVFHMVGNYVTAVALEKLNRESTIFPLLAIIPIKSRSCDSLLSKGTNPIKLDAG